MDFLIKLNIAGLLVASFMGIVIRNMNKAKASRLPPHGRVAGSIPRPRNDGLED